MLYQLPCLNVGCLQLETNMEKISHNKVRKSKSAIHLHLCDNECLFMWGAYFRMGAHKHEMWCGFCNQNRCLHVHVFIGCLFSVGIYTVKIFWYCILWQFWEIGTKCTSYILNVPCWGSGWIGCLGGCWGGAGDGPGGRTRKSRTYSSRNVNKLTFATLSVLSLALYKSNTEHLGDLVECGNSRRCEVERVGTQGTMAACIMLAMPDCICISC